MSKPQYLKTLELNATIEPLVNLIERMGLKPIHAVEYMHLEGRHGIECRWVVVDGKVTEIYFMRWVRSRVRKKILQCLQRSTHALVCDS